MRPSRRGETASPASEPNVLGEGTFVVPRDGIDSIAERLAQSGFPTCFGGGNLILMFSGEPSPSSHLTLHPSREGRRPYLSDQGSDEMLAVSRTARGSAREIHSGREDPLCSRLAAVDDQPRRAPLDPRRFVQKKRRSRGCRPNCAGQTPPFCCAVSTKVAECIGYPLDAESTAGGRRRCALPLGTLR